MPFIPLAIKPQSDIQLENQESLDVGEDLERRLRIEDTFKKFTPFPRVIGELEQEVALKEKFREKIMPDEANSEFGIPGRLQFKEPVSRELAEKKQREVLRQADIEDFLSKASQTNNFFDKSGNLLLGFGVMATDPINYIPITSATKLFRLGKALKFTQPFFKNPIARSATDAALGNLIEQPIIAENFENLGLTYTVEDGLFDVAFGGLIGGTFGLLRRNVAGTKVLKMRAAAKEAAAQRKAIETQINKETAARLMALVESDAAKGRDTSIGVAEALIKLGDSMEIERKAHSAFYLNDLVYRTEFDELNLPQRERLNSFAKEQALIPEDRYVDFDRAFNLKDATPNRLSDLPGDLARIISRLGSREGFISLRTFVDMLEDRGGINIGAKETKKFISATTGVGKKIKPGTQLNAKQAFALYEAIQERIRQKKLDVDVDSLPLLKQLQKDLREIKDNLDVSFETFRKRFLGLKRQIDQRPDLRRVDIFDLQKLNKQDKELVLSYLKFFQVGNPTEDQIRNLLRGKGDAIRELYEQSKLNVQTKDTITKERATEVLEQHLQSEVAPRKEQEVSDLLGISVKQELDKTLSDSYLTEQLTMMQRTLGDEDFSKISKEMDEVSTKEVDNFIDGAKKAINCVFKAGG